MKTNEEIIYHYTSFENASKILERMQLKASTLEATNDPKEYKDFIENFSLGFGGEKYKDELYRPGNKDLAEIVDGVRNYVKKYIKILSFSIDDNSIEIEKLKIFNRGFAKPQMWSAYGDNHKGVCFGFNKKDIIREIESMGTDELFHGAIDYYSKDYGIASIIPAFKYSKIDENNF